MTSREGGLEKGPAGGISPPARSHLHEGGLAATPVAHVPVDDASSPCRPLACDAAIRSAPRSASVIQWQSRRRRLPRCTLFCIRFPCGHASPTCAALPAARPPVCPRVPPPPPSLSPITAPAAPRRKIFDLSSLRCAAAQPPTVDGCRPQCWRGRHRGDDNPSARGRCACRNWASRRLCRAGPAAAQVRCGCRCGVAVWRGAEWMQGHTDRACRKGLWRVPVSRVNGTNDSHLGRSVPYRPPPAPPRALPE